MALTAIPTIKPLSDLRINLNSICEEIKRTKDPIIMTKNGSPEIVVMSPEAYNHIEQHMRYVIALRESEIEQEYGKKDLFSDKDIKEEINDLFNSLKVVKN